MPRTGRPKKVETDLTNAKEMVTKSEERRLEVQLDSNDAKECTVPKSVLFKANNACNIDGFRFNPYLLVNENEVIVRAGKEYNAIEFLTKKSRWFKRTFDVVTGPVEKKKERLSDKYTKDELLLLANDMGIKVDSKLSELELYCRIFGCEVGE